MEEEVVVFPLKLARISSILSIIIFMYSFVVLISLKISLSVAGKCRSIKLDSGSDAGLFHQFFS